VCAHKIAYVYIYIYTNQEKSEKWYDRINDCGGVGGKTQAIQTTSNILCAVEAQRFKQGWKMDDRSSGAMINSFVEYPVISYPSPNKAKIAAFGNLLWVGSQKIILGL
jgi:hypothetical protein